MNEWRLARQRHWDGNNALIMKQLSFQCALIWHKNGIIIYLASAVDAVAAKLSAKVNLFTCLCTQRQELYTTFIDFLNKFANYSNSNSTSDCRSWLLSFLSHLALLFIYKKCICFFASFFFLFFLILLLTRCCWASEPGSKEHTLKKASKKFLKLNFQVTFTRAQCKLNNSWKER